jgi:hypothetical protein
VRPRRAPAPGLFRAAFACLSYLPLRPPPLFPFNCSVRKCLEKYAKFMNLEPSKWQQLSSNITMFSAEAAAGGKK